MIYTSQFRYSGPGRVDITFKTVDPFGKVFAPTKEMVYGYKYKGMSELVYSDMYDALLRSRAIGWAADSFNSLAQVAADETKYVVLVCYCPPHAFCHRLLLMEFMARHFGVPYHGELKA